MRYFDLRDMLLDLEAQWLAGLQPWHSLEQDCETQNQSGSQRSAGTRSKYILVISCTPTVGSLATTKHLRSGHTQAGVYVGNERAQIRRHWTRHRVRYHRSLLSVVSGFSGRLDGLALLPLHLTRASFCDSPLQFDGPAVNLTGPHRHRRLLFPIFCCNDHAWGPVRSAFAVLTFCAFWVQSGENTAQLQSGPVSLWLHPDRRRIRWLPCPLSSKCHMDLVDRPMAEGVVLM